MSFVQIEVFLKLGSFNLIAWLVVKLETFVSDTTAYLWFPNFRAKFIYSAIETAVYLDQTSIKIFVRLSAYLSSSFSASARKVIISVKNFCTNAFFRYCKSLSLQYARFRATFIYADDIALVSERAETMLWFLNTFHWNVSVELSEE